MKIENKTLNIEVLSTVYQLLAASSQGYSYGNNGIYKFLRIIKLLGEDEKYLSEEARNDLLSRKREYLVELLKCFPARTELVKLAITDPFLKDCFPAPFSVFKELFQQPEWHKDPDPIYPEVEYIYAGRKKDLLEIAKNLLINEEEYLENQNFLSEYRSSFSKLNPVLKRNSAIILSEKLDDSIKSKPKNEAEMLQNKIDSLSKSTYRVNTISKVKGIDRSYFVSCTDAFNWKKILTTTNYNDVPWDDFSAKELLEICGKYAFPELLNERCNKIGEEEFKAFIEKLYYNFNQNELTNSLPGTAIMLLFIKRLGNINEKSSLFQGLRKQYLQIESSFKERFVKKSSSHYLSELGFQSHDGDNLMKFLIGRILFSNKHSKDFEKVFKECAEKFSSKIVEEKYTSLEEIKIMTLAIAAFLPALCSSLKIEFSDSIVSNGKGYYNYIDRELFDKFYKEFWESNN